MIEYLLLLLAFPIIWPFISKKIWPHDISWVEIGLNVGIVALIVTGVWFAGKYGATADTEIWNGKIVSKDRVHGHYVRTYSCNCTSYSCGTSKSPRTCETCQTCTEDHYTIKWLAHANFGGNYDILLDSYDSTSRSRRNAKPDPTIYNRCEPGEPASIENTYTNYVQAVPDSLFNNAMNDQVYADQIPVYPSVFGKYHIKRVLNVDATTDGLNVLNTKLNEHLRTLGPNKQANIVVIVTGITDSSYRYAVENAWLGAKKNDIVVFLGTNGAEVLWVDVMTFAMNKGNELFQVTLRDDLAAMDTFDPIVVADTIASATSKLFDRISMEEFKYLEKQVSPAVWVIWLAAFLSIFGTLGLSFLFKHVDIGSTGRYRRY